MTSPRDLLAGHAVEPHLDLPIEHAQRLVALALLERLADAHDRRQLGAERRHEPAVDQLVGLAEEPPPLRVPDDHVLGARLAHHLGADLAGERALTLPVQVLRRRRRRSSCAPPPRRHARAVNGGATTISTSMMSFTRLRNSLTNTTDSCTVLCIFQLAAMNGMRMSALSVQPSALRLEPRFATSRRLTAR